MSFSQIYMFFEAGDQPATNFIRNFIMIFSSEVHKIFSIDYNLTILWPIFEWFVHKKKTFFLEIDANF